MRKILVLGAGYVMTAVRLGRRVRGQAEVVLVSASDRFVERIRLHQVAAEQRMPVREIAPLLARAGVRFVRGTIGAIDPARRQVEVDGVPLAYDRLVLALGSHVDTTRVPVAANVFTLDQASSEALGRALPDVAARAGRLVVVGGGLTGIEAASELAERYPSLKVTLVTARALGEELSNKGRAYLARALARLGVVAIEHTQMRAVGPGHLITDAVGLPFDVCVWAGGFAASPLSARAGLSVNERGQALVDPLLRSVSHPEVYVVGDAACPVEDAGAPIAMSCKTAMPMGAHAADNLTAWVHGWNERSFRFGDTGMCISLGRRDGIVQLRRKDGSNRETIYTGRLGAWIKEQICRYTWLSLRLEARGWLHYRWVHRQLPPALGSSGQKRLAA